jgi:ATP synthase protein I
VRADAVHRKQITITAAVDEEFATRVCGGRRKTSPAAFGTARNQPLPPAAEAGIYVYSHELTASAPILDSYGPSQYGPRGLGAAEVSRSAWTVAGVESMADDAREKGDREQPSLDEAALSARLKRLGERLGHVHSDRPSESSLGQRPTADPSAIARGFRLSTELVAGVLVGAAVGWLIDRWLGISPWGMIVFLLLGFAAGVLNVMRAAGVVPTKTLDPPNSN